MNAVLEVENLRKSYGKRSVLQGASFTAYEGQVVAIVGENGSGKSTMLKILVGLLSADAGHVHLSGRIGYCPQALALYERLTVAEHLAYFGAAYGIAERELTAASDRYLDLFRFSHYLSTKISELSEGTKQKLNLTLALIHSPSLLLLDEPYQGFDWETFKAFTDSLQDMRKEGKCVLLISHLVTTEVNPDRMLTLKDGVVNE